jgi:hypothetical protein
MKPRRLAEVPHRGGPSTTPPFSPVGPASGISPPLPAVDPAGTPPRAPSKGKGGPSTYLTVLLDNHGPDGRPDGTRKEVEVKLIRRNPSTVVVELPDGQMVKRKIRRDVVAGIEPVIKGGVLWDGVRQ